MNQLVANIILASSLKSSICSPKQPNSRKILNWFTNSLRETSHGLKNKIWKRSGLNSRYTIVPIESSNGTSNIDHKYIQDFLKRDDLDMILPHVIMTHGRYKTMDFTACTDTMVTGFVLPAVKINNNHADISKPFSTTVRSIRCFFWGSMIWFWTVSGLVVSVRLFRTDDHGAGTDFQRAWSEISVETTIFR